MAEPTTSTLLNDIATLIRAVGTLLWPLVAGYVVIRNEKQIRSLLDRLRKGKILGQEIELEGSLKELKRQVSAVEDETPPTQLPVSIEPSTAILDPLASLEQSPGELPLSESRPARSRGAADPFLGEILDIAARSPTVALMQLASGIERLANQIWSDLDDGSKPLRPSVRNLIDGLSHVLPKSVPAALRTFWEVRNRIVHGRDADEHETLSALDSGISLYKSLVSFSRSYAVVTRSEIPLYTDETTSTRVPNGTGVEVEFRSNGEREIWPTTQKGYVPQMVVKTDYDVSTVFYDVWIKDDLTGEAEKLFDSAADFVGTPISVRLRS